MNGNSIEGINGEGYEMGNENSVVINSDSSHFGPWIQGPDNSKPKVTVDQRSLNAQKKVPIVTREEAPRQSNKQDLVILHKMKNLQKQGVTGLEGFMSHVIIPNPEMVDYALLNRGANTVLNPLPIPPDKDKTSDHQKGMEIDLASSSLAIACMSNDVNHVENANLDGQISIIKK
ncbi:hypothetical protein RIF29_40224 [Crotalaria pallida]|uniref:Uncharacterized protein n=1 Tax=Crotalaria pallida TaxID=3830 RepID=A0AAN9HQG4_CROPI